MPDPISVLVVDDEEEGRALLLSLLEALGFRAAAMTGGAEALALLLRGVPSGAADEPRFDVVILDVLMPELDGLTLLRRYRAAGGDVPVVMVSALDEAATALQAVRLGANDYVTKPFDGDELREVIERVAGGPRSEGRPPPGPAAPRTAAPAGNAATRLGQSAAMQRVAELIDRIADVDVPILITGESGVGKDVAARDIHARSARRDKVFVKINCAALPGELLESELFGHERGSFTGAARTKPGQFELADGGTLFLDEIGEMPVALQAKLLQALQDGEFYRVGGQRRIRVDARVLCATNRNLPRAIADGSFREDLYYRLNVVHFEIPPLRERREDIPQLVAMFGDKYARRYGRDAAVPPQVMSRFLTWDWPGNIRELENMVRRLVVLRDPSYVLGELRERPASATGPAAPGLRAVDGAPTSFAPAGGGAGSGDPRQLAEASAGNMTAPSGTPAAGGVASAQDPGVEADLRIDLKEVGRKAAQQAEREAIVIMLAHTGGNKREAAERLGISYKAILYKIREYGIGRPRLPRRSPVLPPLHPAAAAGVPVTPRAVSPPLDALAALGGATEPVAEADRS